MDVLRCATLNVGKPSHKDQAYNDLVKVDFASKVKYIARKKFIQENYKTSYIKIWFLGHVFTSLVFTNVENVAHFYNPGDLSERRNVALRSLAILVYIDMLPETTCWNLALDSFAVKRHMAVKRHPLKHLSRNLFVFTAEDSFKKIGVSLAIVNWLLHNVCCTVEHVHLRRECSYRKRLYLMF